MSDERNRRRIGRARLARVLPLALAEAKRAGPVSVEKATAVAGGMMRHVSPDNIEAIHITRGEYGGWCCDIILREVPAGIPNSFGTPVRFPHATEAEAEASAVPLLAMGLAAGEQARASNEPPPPRVFDYFGLECPMPEPALRFMETVTAHRPDLRWNSAQRARDELDEVTERFFSGAEPTLEAFNALPQESKAWLFMKFGYAMLEGMFRYPEWRAEPPGKFERPGPEA